MADENTGLSKKIIKKQLLQFFEDNPTAAFNYKQIAKQLEIQLKHDRDKLLTALEELFVDGYIDETKRGKFHHVPQTQFVIGKIDMTKSGSGFLVSEDLEDDVYIGTNSMNTALHGDEVKVLLYARRKGKRPEGEVVEVINRVRDEFVGVLQVSDRFAFLVPDSRKMPIDIFVPMKNLNGGKDGEKALVKISEWPGGKGKNPVGTVIKVLGEAGLHSTEMNAIIAEFDLPEEFPNEVDAEADAISEEIPQSEIKKRRDMRKIPTFTIDPEDAKDFDDALSIRKLDNGNWEIGIHIADVTHYVRPGTALEAEGFNRATSIYLVDRVIPMLPEKLSNKLCSLRPDEDKLTFSVIVEMDDEAIIKNEWYGKTIIRSQKRFSYEDAQEILETGKGTFKDELLKMNQLAYKLRERKFDEGAISFETVEVKFKLDENGKPLAVIPKERKDAHRLIEDFMLLANRKVAEFIFKRSKDWQEAPFVYRVHDAPSDEKLSNFKRIAARFGYEFNTADSRAISQSFNNLLEVSQGTPQQNFLQALAIRTMSKAFYTTKKSSHYGLAFDYYTHFTSPIRRYPDMIAHRLLEHYLHSQKKIDQDLIEMQCRHSSEMEVRAEEAERASIKYKQVEYIKERLGEDFLGVVSGVTEWGMYVEIIENRCEGMIRLSNMTDDYYTLDEENYRIIGENTGKIYQLGDKIKVKVAEANLLQRTIDFELVEMTEEELEEAEKEKKERKPILDTGQQNGAKKKKQNKDGKGGGGKKSSSKLGSTKKPGKPNSR